MVETRFINSVIAFVASLTFSFLIALILKVKKSFSKLSRSSWMFFSGLFLIKLSGSSSLGKIIIPTLKPLARSFSIALLADLRPGSSPSYMTTTSLVNFFKTKHCPSVREVPEEDTVLKIFA